MTVLEYEPKQHQMLTQCVTEWADYAEMGLLDHRRAAPLMFNGRQPVNTSMFSMGVQLHMAYAPCETQL